MKKIIDLDDKRYFIETFTVDELVKINKSIGIVNENEIKKLENTIIVIREL